MLPLLLTAMKDGRLSLRDIVQRCVVNPRHIFGLTPQTDTWIEVDTSETFKLKTRFSKCGWSPFDGWVVTGRVKRVILRDRLAFDNGVVLAPPGFGRNVERTQVPLRAAL